MSEQISNIQVIPPGITKWEGTAVLTSRGCTLVERFTGKSYAYRVFNTETGKSTYICHKKNPVSEPERMDMIDGFINSTTNPDAEHHIDTNNNAKISIEKLMEDLIYIFETLLPKYGYSLRKEQLELAKDALYALYRRMISLSEAGVGIGKTHAYLIAATIIKHENVNDFWLRSNYPDMAYVSKMPVVVATSSIALQKSIIRDYIPDISRILMEHGAITRPISCVIRKGKDHYLCEKRLHLFWDQSTDTKAKQLIEPIIEGRTGIDLDEMDFLTFYVKRKINVNTHCGMSCNFRKSCRYRAFIENARSDKHDFQICNHNYLLADVMRRAKGQTPLVPNYQAIVIDEAHKFLTAARQMYGMTLSNSTFSLIAKTIRKFVFQQGQSTADLWRDVRKLRKQSDRLFNALVKNIPSNHSEDAERFKTQIDSNALNHLRNIRSILSRVTDGLKKRQVIQKYESLYNHTLSKIEGILQQISAFKSCDDIIYWIEKPECDDTSEISLCAIPKKLGEFLHTDLWGKGVPIILTSATLTATGHGSKSKDFSHIKQSFGLDKLKSTEILETSRPSPFDYRNNGLIYISENVPFPDGSTRYIEALTAEMEQLILAAHGHTVGLFTSYRAMDMVFDLLAKRELHFPLFKLERGRINTIDQFKQSGNGVLLASGSLWEGIDLPGDILSLLIITKLPFAVPDPISEYEMIQCGGMDKYRNAVIIPEMQVKVKQGGGRAFRNERDAAVIAICDIRAYYGKAFHEATIRALPPCPTTDSIDDVRRFIEEKKPIEYFGGTL